MYAAGAVRLDRRNVPAGGGDCAVSGPGGARTQVYRPAGGDESDLHPGDSHRLHPVLPAGGALLYGLLNLLAVAVLSRVAVEYHRKKEEQDK